MEFFFFLNLLNWIIECKYETPFCNKSCSNTNIIKIKIQNCLKNLKWEYFMNLNVIYKNKFPFRNNFLFSFLIYKTSSTRINACRPNRPSLRITDDVIAYQWITVRTTHGRIVLFLSFLLSLSLPPSPQSFLKIKINYQISFNLCRSWKTSENVLLRKLISLLNS